MTHRAWPAVTRATPAPSIPGVAAWFDPVADPDTGVLLETNQGTIYGYGGAGDFFAGIINFDPDAELVWTPLWVAGPEIQTPTLTDMGDGVLKVNILATSTPTFKVGVLTLIATIDGEDAGALVLDMTVPGGDEFAPFTHWGPAP